MQRSWYWPASHNELLKALLERAGEAEVTYIPGNHDEAARQFPGLQLGDMALLKKVFGVRKRPAFGV